MSYTDNEKYLRELAVQIAEYSNTDENAMRIKRWRDVNALRKPDRMPVYTFPSGAVWNEIIPKDSIRCDPGHLREIEITLRKRLYQMFVDDDTPQPESFHVSAEFDVKPSNIWGLTVHAPDVENGAWVYDPPLEDPEDFSKLQIPEYTYNSIKTETKLNEVQRIMGDILPPKLVCNHLLSPDVGYYAALFRGLGNLFTDTLIEPELLHKIMQLVTTGILGSLDAIEATGLVTPNTDGDLTYVHYSDPINQENTGGAYSMKDCWCIASSQEFDAVSPEKWEEFVLNYQKRIFERYGLVSYGCCENLTQKIDGVMSIENLRIFVCSPWTDLGTLIERTGGKYVIQWRQKASEVIFAKDMTGIREHLRRGVQMLKGIPTQITLREVETLNGNLHLQKQWAAEAKEAAAAM